MKIGMSQNVAFKAETPKTEDKPQTIQNPATITQSIKKDSVNFGKNKEDAIEFEKSHFLTKVLGGGGLFLGLISGIGVAKIHSVPDGIGAAVGTAIKCLLFGLIGDFCINKTVENTTKSIKLNFQNGET